MEFDLDIFSTNDRPFAGYAEPDGYLEIAQRKRVTEADYLRLVPNTVGIARSLFGGMLQRDKWGKQVEGKFGPQWVTEVRGNSYAARNGGKRPGQALTANGVLRSLARPNVFAYGRTDSHVADVEFPRYGREEFHTTKVDCLCLDIDMDIAWSRKDRGMVQHEIAREREIARALGLLFRVFRTGGRGHQVVLPLPAPVDRSVATWLLHAFISLLSPYHIQEVKDKGLLLAHADASNLEKIVRLAGGRHIKTGRLALWIDPDTGQLHDLDRQTDLMRRGYRYPADSSVAAENFSEAAEEMAAFLEPTMVFRHECPDMPFRSIMFRQALTALPANLLVERYSTAEEEWGQSETSPPLKVRKPVAKAIPAEPSTTPHSLEALESLRDWAARVWGQNWGEGTFWDWINESGARGITAAKILFGDQALSKLIERTHSAPHVTVGEPHEWRRVINSLYLRHEMLGYRARLNPLAVIGTLSEDAAVLIPGIMASLDSHKHIQSRNRTDIEHIVYVVLLAFEKATAGFICMSQEPIRDSILAHWPEAPVDTMTVWRHLLRIKEGDPACGYSLLKTVVLDRSGQNQAAQYRPGTDLRATAFGRGLPLDTSVDAPVRASGPIEMEVRSAITGHTHMVDLSAVKRGRQPKLQN